MRVLLLLLVAACGSPPTPQPPSNQVGSSSTGSAAATRAANHAKVVQRAQTGGVIELAGDDRGASMEEANNEMIAHCGPEKYVITQEGEEAVAGPSGGGRTETAWRVHYECTH